MKEQERLIRLAEECLLREGKERPELVWLKGIYERFRADCGLLGKSEADSLIFEKMYSRAPEKASDVLKIRYWRTGRHVPLTGHSFCHSESAEYGLPGAGLFCKSLL